MSPTPDALRTFYILVRYANRLILFTTTLILVVGCGEKPHSTDTQSSIATTDDATCSSLAKEYVELYSRNARLRYQQTFFENQAALGVAGPDPFDDIPGYSSLPPSSQEAIVAALDSTGRQLLSGAIDGERQQAAAVEQLKKQWTGVRTTRNEAEVQLAEVAGSKRAAGQVATLLSLDNRWFWLAALLAFAVLVAVAFHDRRHEIRRMMNGARARAMGVSIILQILLVLMLLGTIVVFLFGNRIYDRLIDSGAGNNARTLSSMAQELEELKLENDSLSQQITDLSRQPSFPTTRNLTTRDQPSGLAEAQTWGEIQRKLVSASTLADVKSRLAAGMAVDLEQIKTLTIEHANNVAAVSRYRFMKALLQLAFGLVILGTIGLSGWVLLKGMAIRFKEIADTCPLCLGTDNFQVVSDASLSRRSELHFLRCSNVISELPHEECRFEFLSVYRDMPKLCFPTLGHPNAGKTHWLAMLYRELNRGNFSANVQFDKVKSNSSMEFDDTINDILNARRGPAGTQTASLPHPLIFNFSDNDRLGRSNVLINIFDYSGEVTISRTLDDPHRRRALDADGYLFFLDPTYLAGPQADGLVNFREDVRAIRGVQTGQTLQSPVALCVPKIDLLTTQSYADSNGEGPIAAFYSALREIDPTGTDFSLRTIEARSRLVQDLRDTIWPGWQIERQIHDLFGGRFMFFPLTPVGMSELGEPDLQLRTIAPYAILEPLAWLLHMNGYPILK